MARCLNCIHCDVCDIDRHEKEHLYGDCSDFLNGTDVVPKSEYDLLKKSFKELTQEAKGYLNRIYGIRADVAREVIEEINDKLYDMAMEYHEAGLPVYFAVCEMVYHKVIRPVEKKYTEEQK